MEVQKNYKSCRFGIVGPIAESINNIILTTLAELKHCRTLEMTSQTTIRKREHVFIICQDVSKPHEPKMPHPDSRQAWTWREVLTGVWGAQARSKTMDESLTRRGLGSKVSFASRAPDPQDTRRCKHAQYKHATFQGVLLGTIEAENKIGSC